MRLGNHDITGVTALNTAGVLVVAYLIVVLAQTINHNYNLDRQITQQNAQIALLQAQKAQLSYQIKYYGTQSYLEKQAHSQLGLVNPGETEVVLPSTAPTPTPAAVAMAATAKQSNWSQWISFLNGGN